MTTIDEAKKQILESNYFADKETVSELFEEHQSLKMDGAFFMELMEKNDFRYLNFADDSMYSNPKIMLTAYENHHYNAEILDEYLPNHLKNDHDFMVERLDAIERGEQRENEMEMQM